MTFTSQLTGARLLRKTIFGWRHGALPARLMTGATIVLALALAWASWQAVRSDKEADRLSARLTNLQSARAVSAAAIQAAEPPDVIQTLSSAPSVAEVVQTLHQATGKEGAQVMSLQAEDHPPTSAELGHLDLILSLKAPYPSIVIVVRQVLDRYPGATLRQMLVAPMASATPVHTIAVAPAAMGASTSQAVTEAEAHVTLAFWRRPLGVDGVTAAATEQPVSTAASAGASAAVPASLAVPDDAKAVPMGRTSPSGATPLAPLNGAASASKK